MGIRAPRRTDTNVMTGCPDAAAQGNYLISNEFRDQISLVMDESRDSLVTRFICHETNLSRNLFVTRLSCHETYLSRDLLVTRPICHDTYLLTRLFCHEAFLSRDLFVTRPFCHETYLSRYFSVTRPFVTRLIYSRDFFGENLFAFK